VLRDVLGARHLECKQERVGEASAEELGWDRTGRHRWSG